LEGVKWQSGCFAQDAVGYRYLCLPVKMEAEETVALIVGDVSSPKLVKTRMAKSVLDSGWGMLKGFLEYKSQQAARSFEVVSERNTSVTCSHCRALTGPRGVNGLIVRSWVCGNCGELHDRDVNATRNILIGSRSRTSVRGNEPSSWLILPSRVYCVREAGIESAWAAA